MVENACRPFGPGLESIWADVADAGAGCRRSWVDGVVRGIANFVACVAGVPWKGAGVISFEIAAAVPSRGSGLVLVSGADDPFTGASDATVPSRGSGMVPFKGAGVPLKGASDVAGVPSGGAVAER